MELERNYKDEMLELGFVNLYTLSKNSKIVHLNYFNRKNDAHLCLLEIAKALRGIYGYQIVIHCSFLDSIYMKIFYALKTKHLKYVRNSTELDERTNCDTFISNIENSFEHVGEFKKIYREYYCG